MELPWQHYLKLYAPMIVLGLFSALGAIYTFGFEDGKRAIVAASAHAVDEARNGGAVPCG